MRKSRYDIANTTVTVFLQEVARFYDEARGYKPFGPDTSQLRELLSFFDSSCCYCGSPLDLSDTLLDYLVPIDRLALGLHAWGNVVPCCEVCHTARQQKTWHELISITFPISARDARVEKIEAFRVARRYDLSLNLRSCVDSLYEDVGAVAMTLVQLRYKQAEQKVRATLAAGLRKSK